MSGLSCKELSPSNRPRQVPGLYHLRRKCPSNAIMGGKNLIHIVDRRSARSAAPVEVCPPRFRAITKISGVPVPPPVPEEARTIVRESKQK